MLQLFHLKHYIIFLLLGISLDNSTGIYAVACKMCLPVRLDNTTNSKLKGTKFVCHVFGLDDQNQKAFQMETAG